MRIRPGRFVLGVVSALVTVWLIAPVFAIIPVSLNARPTFVLPPQEWSFRWYENLFTSPQWLNAIQGSVTVAIGSTVLATIIGTLAALGLWRLATPRIRETLRGTMLLPQIVPEILLAVGIYILFLRMGLTGNYPGFLLAHTVVGLPFVVLNVSGSLASFDSNLLRAAWSLGATPWSATWKVVLPAIRPGIMTGALFAFVMSMDNTVISMLLASPRLRTLPVQMWSSMTSDTDPTIAAAAVVILAVSIAALLLIQIQRRIRASHQTKVTS